MHLWKPPSFDEPLPPLPDVLVMPERLSPGLGAENMAQCSAESLSQDRQSLKAKAHQEGFLRGLQEGLAEGRLQG